MKTIDFPNSYLTWRTDWEELPSKTASSKPLYSLNNARIPIDCHCMIREQATGEIRNFILGVNCKTERVGAPKDIWTQPNADFVPVFSKDEYLMIKTFDRIGQRVQLYPASLGKQAERQSGRCDDTFTEVRIDLVHREGALLKDNVDVVAAVLENRQLVARTEYQDDRYTVVLDYPVRTINANERDNIFQTDTGPILLPDLSRNTDDLIGGFELAFSAFNSVDWIEFIVRVPTRLTDEVSVHHFSKPMRLDSKNTIIGL